MDRTIGINNRHIATAAQLITEYDGILPMHHYLKKHFKATPNAGSRDRKWIAEMVYSYYRVKAATNTINIEDGIRIGLFLSSKIEKLLLSTMPESWKAHILDTTGDKIALLKATFPTFEFGKIFPQEGHISNEIDLEAFKASLLVQPRVYVRLKSGFETVILSHLRMQTAEFEVIDTNTLAFEPTVNLDMLLGDDFNGSFYIQDLSSQSTVKHFPIKPKSTWWDACAGAGGKSILAQWQNPTMRLACTDRRETIMENLKHRFFTLGIKHYEIATWDILDTANIALPFELKIDGIIADVPCTGSGTWGRTPEAMHYFEETKIRDYAAIQQSLITKLCQYLSKGQALVYITCSVFGTENEENINWFTQNLPLKCINQTYLKGYNSRADSMFVAVLEKL